jgi:hypothetical protein
MANIAILVQGGDGTAGPAGMVGERIAISSAATSVTTNSATATTVAVTQVPSKGVYIVIGAVAFSFSSAPTVGTYSPMALTTSNCNAALVNSSALPSKPSSENAQHSLPVLGYFIADGSTAPNIGCISYSGNSVSPTATFSGELVRIA